MKKVISQAVRISICLSISFGLALSVSLIQINIGEVDTAQALVSTKAKVKPKPKKAKPITKHKYFVALVNTTDQQTNSDVAYSKKVVNTSADYWKIQSRGKISKFETSSVKTYTSKHSCSSGTSLKFIAEAQASFRSQISKSVIPHIVVIIPEQCRGGGALTIQALGVGSTGSSLKNGGNIIMASLGNSQKDFYFSSDAGTLEHETGHNFGLDHSNTTTLQSSVYKKTKEYAGNHDIMGNISQGTRLGAVFQEKLGILKKGEMVTREKLAAGSVYTYQIKPITNSNGQQIIKFKNPNKNLVKGEPTYYYIEYRAQAGMDKVNTKLSKKNRADICVEKFGAGARCTGDAYQKGIRISYKSGSRTVTLTNSENIHFDEECEYYEQDGDPWKRCKPEYDEVRTTQAFSADTIVDLKNGVKVYVKSIEGENAVVRIGYKVDDSELK